MIAQEEYEKLQKRHRVTTEERNIYLQKLQEMQKEVDDLRVRLDSKQDEFELLEREYKKLQDKHRDTLNSEYALQTAKEQLEQSMRVMQEDIQRLGAEYDEAVYRFNKEQKEVISQLAQAKNGYHKAQEEVSKQRGKCRQYKEKLRLANTTIKVLSSKVA